MSFGITDFERRLVNPLVGIDLTRNSSPELRRTISEVVYSAMTEIANVPAHDKFQIFTLFEPDELVFPPEGHLDIDYTQDIIFIQVYWASSSTIDTKTAFFRRICDDLHARWVILADADRTDWSFGKGEMQYEPRLHIMPSDSFTTFPLRRH
jgi:4-oxalocrotonate tautomerase